MEHFFLKQQQLFEFNAVRMVMSGRLSDKWLVAPKAGPYYNIISDVDPFESKNLYRLKW